ncbi:MAG: hypothetical protein JWO96_847 [Candidatus Saccharibacteria bacterium]|nr:hypothetical protein [Candidatus Saccharibacteria bacterium]
MQEDEPYKGLLYPQGWDELFWRPESEEYREALIALAKSTQELSNEPWIQDGGELLRRWQHAIEHTAIYSLGPQDRVFLTEVETVELATALVVATVMLAGEWRQPGISFPVHPLSQEAADDEGIVVDLRDY